VVEDFRIAVSKVFWGPRGRRDHGRRFRPQARVAASTERLMSAVQAASRPSPTTAAKIVLEFQYFPA